MEMVLEITSAEKHLMGDRFKHTFMPAGGVIGRAPECDWVIPDQTRLVSGRHAIVSYEAGQYFLTDISTNGTYLNGVDAIAKNQAVALNDGDRLTLGQIHVAVRIQVGEQPSVGPSASTIMVEPPLGPSGANPMEKLDQWSAQQDQRERQASPQWHQQSQSMPDDVPAYHEPFIAPEMAKKSEARKVANPVSDEDKALPEDWWQEPMAAADSETPGEKGPPEKGPASVLAEALQKPKQEAENAAALKAFAKGLGVSVESLEAAGGVDFLRQSGRLLRLCMEGMVSMAQARASLKNEFRLDMTLVHNRGNNPIKFAANGEQAIKHLFTEENGSFLPMDKALQECFDDIKQHQLATLAGMQGAFLDLMQTLSPQALEKRFQRQRSGGMTLGSKSARYWEAYQELHQDLLSEEDLFASLFAEPFAKAYDEQIEKLKKSKRS